MAKVRFTVVLDINTYGDRNVEDIEFWLNESTLCVGDFLCRRIGRDDCGCSHITAEVLEVYDE